VTVLHEGALLCEGTVAEVQRNPQVVQIYLGRERQGNGRANAQD
jgi:urea transport system ATP-binding protein